MSGTRSMYFGLINVPGGSLKEDLSLRRANQHYTIVTTRGGNNGFFSAEGKCQSEDNCSSLNDHCRLASKEWNSCGGQVDPHVQMS